MINLACVNGTCAAFIIKIIGVENFHGCVVEFSKSKISL